jgi:hypothetical protein
MGPTAAITDTYQAVGPIAPTPAQPQVLVPHFEGIIQGMPNWCWAAIATSIRNCYVAQAGETPLARQCELVHFGLQYDDGTPVYGCTGHEPSPTGCVGVDPSKNSPCANPDANNPAYLWKVLQCDGIARFCIEVGAGTEMVGEEEYPKQLSDDVISREVGRGRPVAVRYAASEVRAHFTVVYGYVDNAQGSVLMWDPAVGMRQLASSDALRSYDDMPMLEYFLTCPYPPGTELKDLKASGP